MAYLPELHYCCMCNKYLGPDNGDAICCDCEDKFDENGELIEEMPKKAVKP